MDEGTSPDEGTMLYWLSRAAREARERADRLQVDIATSLRSNQITIGRFERGERWPRDVDEMLAAYGDALGIDPRDIWAEALRLWREHASVASVDELRDR